MAKTKTHYSSPTFFAPQFQFRDPDGWVFPEGTGNLLQRMEHSRETLPHAGFFTLFLYGTEVFRRDTLPDEVIKGAIHLGGTIPRRRPFDAPDWQFDPPPVVESFVLGTISELLALPYEAVLERICAAASWLEGSAHAQGGVTSPGF